MNYISVALGCVALIGFGLAFSVAAFVNKNNSQGNTDMLHALLFLIAAAICFK